MPSDCNGIAVRPFNFLLSFMLRAYRFALRFILKGGVYLFFMLLGCGFAVSPSFAESDITYQIEGVEQDVLRNNIRIHLASLNVETSLLTDPYWQMKWALP
ncbi:MAG: hypothetical protein VXZ36_01860 [Pseudomonadota bacterium]|nr:hypothetical protein [Pseudomonadota bacterium]